MKKAALFLVLIIPLLLSAGCIGGEAAAFTPEDLSLTLNGVRYYCDMNMETVIAGLGEEYAYAEGMSCDYDGLDKTFLYEEAVFYTNPLSEGDLVNEIYTESPAVSTSRGIGVGASKSDVLAAYGDGCDDEGDLLIYRLEGERAALCFEIENEAVWAIYLTTQPV